MPVLNLKEFNAAIDRVVQQVPGKVLIIQKKIALQALRGVVLKTPVDTGRARGGWQVSLDSLSLSPTPVFEKGKHRRNEAGQFVEGEQTVIASGSAVIKQLKTYGTIFIANNVSYIIYLENGSSKQAPNGMLALTLQEISTQFI